MLEAVEWGRLLARCCASGEGSDLRRGRGCIDCPISDFLGVGIEGCGQCVIAPLISLSYQKVFLKPLSRNRTVFFFFLDELAKPL